MAAVHHSFTEINLYLHNIRNIYVHIRRRDVQVNLHPNVFTTQILYFEIIVKIRIKTPNFPYIILNAISPHLRF